MGVEGGGSGFYGFRVRRRGRSRLRVSGSWFGSLCALLPEPGSDVMATDYRTSARSWPQQESAFS